MKLSKPRSQKTSKQNKDMISNIDITGLSEEEIARLEAEAALQKYDKESSYRNNLKKVPNTIVSIILISFSLFQLGTSILGVLPAQLQRSYHLAFVIALVYLLYPARKGGRKDIIPWYDVVLAIISTGLILYIPYNYRYLMANMGNYRPIEFIIAVAGILAVMEACRRVVGIPILAVVCAFIAYAYFGPYMPGFLWHGGYSITRIANYLFYTTEGVFGTPLGVSATYIFLFILFGAFLEKTGVGKLFIDLSNAIAGKAPGGPAKVAVIASALEGTVSGSSVANTVGSGSFTIPTMKKLGYKPEFAAAVEAAASTGGQIMPPIMGAAAFLMADIIGVGYSKVVVSAIIPAVLYFAGVLISVHVEAKKIGLRGMDAADIPSIKTIMLERGHLLLALVVMITVLSMNFSPIFAALAAIATSIVSSSLRKNTRLKFQDIIDALQNGARSILGVAIACAMAGIIVGVVGLTGLGLNLANGLVELAGGKLLPMLFFTMISSLILGMGVPTTANYLITSTICAPALLKMGVPIMAAHMFVFYFGIIADITPPVALAAMAGSAIAKSDPFKTGITATRIAIAAFIVPYIFALNPQMLMIDVTAIGIIQILVTSLVGMYAISGALGGYFLYHVYWYERIILIVAGLMLIYPELITDIVGLIIISIIGVLQTTRKKRELQKEKGTTI
ncbi:MAG TPA: TRAP transporter permease [Clostridiaceae bacterium]|nr:TRAP transporter permease [Clostridiaceae bacterium]